MFCGRVFIFLFQSFPLGDKSAVNLRGEYHTENVTTFDEITKPATEEKKDEEDVEMSDQKEPEEQPAEKDPQQSSGEQDSPKTPKVVVSNNTENNKNAEKKVDMDTLYPMFWGLQAYFSSPTRMFDPQHFASFKEGLESTLFAFKNINTDLENPTTSRSAEELRKSMKRKRTSDDPEIASSFNPKYLTSRDLFDLEVCVYG